MGRTPGLKQLKNGEGGEMVFPEEGHSSWFSVPSGQPDNTHTRSTVYMSKSVMKRLAMNVEKSMEGQGKKRDGEMA